MHRRRPNHRQVAKTAIVMSLLVSCVPSVLAQDILWEIYIDDGMVRLLVTDKDNSKHLVDQVDWVVAQIQEAKQWLVQQI